MSTSKFASICFIVCVIHFSFLSYLAKRQFPNVDEIAHLPAGISHWKFARFDLYEVSPPLIDLISSSSALLSSSEFDWTEYRVFRGARSEFTIGRTWLSNVKTKSSESFFFPRLLCGLLSVGGCACLTCIVANHLGYTTAMICCLLWCFSPSILAGGSTIIPDVGAMAIGVAACAAISDFCKRMSIETSLKAGVWLGLCLLSKLTWISFVLLVPLIVLFVRILVFHYRPALSGMFILRVFTLLSVAVLVLNAGYFFENTMQPLGEFRFLSESFAGNEGLVNEPVGNRFRGTWLSNVPVFVPANFIEGIDYLRMEVENKYWSFLDGEWRFGSWPYYYVMTTLYKTPEPTLIAAVMGFFIFIVGWWRGLAKPELVSMVLLLTIPAAVCFLSVSVQGGFNHHHRYVLMIYPPMFVFASLLASPMAEQVFSRKKLCAIADEPLDSETTSVSKALSPWWAIWQRYHWTKILAVVLVSLSVASTLRVHPYYTSYFNTLSGGPENGWHRLGFSNIDWGQDILEVDQWLKKYPERRPLVMDIDYFGTNGDLFDVPTSLPPQLPLGASIDEVRRSITETQWWIISVKKLYNLPGHPGLQYLQQIEPTERIAYAYHVYRIDPLPPEESSSPNEPIP